ncbi:MAG: mazE 2 [Akkermansiaceae bacterium]|nr:mazE 2 [Akkermansiaceae bacterium]
MDKSNIRYNLFLMTAKLKITSIGNSFGVILPKEVLEKLRAEKGDTLFLTETPNGFEMSLIDDKIQRQMEIAEQVMKENRNLLHKLAQ